MFNKLALYSIFCFLLFSCGSSSKSVMERSLHVYGNNDQCKAVIEKAAKLQGVSEAHWDKDSKLLTVKLDTLTTSVSLILKSVAAAGYDNEEFIGNDYAYQKLPEACHYERKEN